MSSPPKSFIRSGTFSGPKPGYAFKNGVKGMGYYKEEEKDTPAAPEAPAGAAPALPADENASAVGSGWSVKCMDGTLDLSESEAAYLSTANLPTGMLPSSDCAAGLRCCCSSHREAC